MDDPAAIIAASRPALARGMPVDFDHALDRSAAATGEAPAAGWITELAARADGIWGRVEWTPPGRERIAGRVYRFISPVFTHDARRRVTRLLRAGLTNKPALELAAICAERDMEDGGKGQDKPDDPAALLARIAELPVIAEGSAPDAILDRVKALLDGARQAAASASGRNAADTTPEAVANMMFDQAREARAAAVEQTVAAAPEVLGAKVRFRRRFPAGAGRCTRASRSCSATS